MNARAQRPPRRIFRFVLFAGLVAAIVLAVMYLRCRGGWGLGGGKETGVGGSTSPRTAVTPPAVDAGVPRCQIRVDGGGISVDGKPATAVDAALRCSKARAADVVITGDARQGTVDELRRGFEAARIEIFERRPEQARPDAGAAAPPLDGGR